MNDAQDHLIEMLRTEVDLLLRSIEAMEQGRLQLREIGDDGKWRDATQDEIVRRRHSISYLEDMISAHEALKGRR